MKEEPIHPPLIILQMNTNFSRTIALIGEENFKKIQGLNILVFGIGGVGGYVCEALARSGVLHFTLVDADKVDPSNINRQIIATEHTIGMDKIGLMKDRILAINFDTSVRIIGKFILPESLDEIDFKEYDYIVDCIDTVTSKIAIICKAKENNIPVISALGAGNRIDATKLVVSDIYKTAGDPLAKVLRHELRKRGVKSLKVVYSLEESSNSVTSEENGRHSPASMVFVPATMGIYIANEIIKDTINK